jgi:hypothetical protein
MLKGTIGIAPMKIGVTMKDYILGKEEYIIRAGDYIDGTLHRLGIRKEDLVEQDEGYEEEEEEYLEEEDEEEEEAEEEESEEEDEIEENEDDGQEDEEGLYQKQCNINVTNVTCNHCNL